MVGPHRSVARDVSASAPWTFLTNHAHVLFCLSRDPELRMREVADAVGVTERAVQRIVADLEEAGYLRREKTGRRNHYELQAEQPLRHPIEQHCLVSELLEVLGRARGASTGARGRRVARAATRKRRD
jgi:predicted ArsR family transcriptional regulator